MHSRKKNMHTTGTRAYVRYLKEHFPPQLVDKLAVGRVTTQHEHYIVNGTETGTPIAATIIKAPKEAVHELMTYAGAGRVFIRPFKALSHHKACAIPLRTTRTDAIRLG